MGRWEVRNGLGCSWHPEPPMDEESRRAGDRCGDELWHLQISFGHVDFCAGSGLGKLRQPFLAPCLWCLPDREDGMGEALRCAEDCPDPW